MNPTAALRPGSRADQEVARFFDARAAGYDTAYEGRNSQGHSLRIRMRTTLELLEGSGGRVLDVGMGPGRLCAALADRGRTVSGVDASLEMVELARARLPQATDRLRQAHVERLPFTDGSFDAVAGTGIFEYVRDRPRALAEIARVLRPGGLAVISVPNPRNPYARAYRWATLGGRVARKALRRPVGERPRGAQPVTRVEFERMLAAVGLAVESVVYTGFLIIPPPLDSLVPRLSVRLAERLEGSGPRLGHRLATQLVVAARRA
jgi:ubiquinone/menaquinone biosynthesis C-methylase UbiE